MWGDIQDIFLFGCPKTIDITGFFKKFCIATRTIKNLETITVSRFFLCLSYPLLYPLRYSKPNCGYRKYRGFTRFTSSRKMTAWFLNAQTNLTQHEPEAVFSASGSSFTLCCFLNNYIVHLNVQIATEREQIVYARHITST